MSDWFRHDTDARNDIKIRKLLRDSEPGALGAYWICVEILFEAGGYEKRVVLTDELSFYNMDKFIDILISHGLLEDVGNGVITSHRVLAEVAYKEERRRQRSEAGKKGMKSRWGHKDNGVITEDNTVITNDNELYQSITEHNTIPNHTLPNNIPLSVSKDTSSPKGSSVSGKASAFIKPTLEEVKAYCKERNNNVNAEEFIDYYESVKWIVGKGKKMGDWKAAVRTWEHKDEKTNRPAPRKDYSDIGVQNITKIDWGV